MRLKDIRYISYSLLDSLVSNYKSPSKGRIEAHNLRLLKAKDDEIHLIYHDNLILKYTPTEVSLHNTHYYWSTCTKSKVSDYFPQREIRYLTDKPFFGIPSNKGTISLFHHQPSVFSLSLDKSNRVVAEPESLNHIIAREDNSIIGGKILSLTMRDKFLEIPVYEGMTFISRFEDKFGMPTYYTDVDLEWYKRYRLVRDSDTLRTFHTELLKTALHHKNYSLMVYCLDGDFNIEAYNHKTNRPLRKVTKDLSSLAKYTFETLGLTVDKPMVIWYFADLGNLSAIDTARYLHSIR